MITENYVSFETAKLLKEKGFDEPIKTCYHKNKFWEYSCNKTYNDDIFKFEENEYSAPTLQMAMKWIRDNYKILISPYALSLGWYFEIFDLTKRDITGCKSLYKVGMPNKEEVLSSYEEAVDAAIKYCLENLI